MKRFNKQILEAINRGILLALDDYEEDKSSGFAPKRDTIRNNNATKDLIDFYNLFVDLDLSSGTLWAKCNIGANSPEEYGNYYAWGELESKKYYDQKTYKFGTNENLVKYNKDDRLTKLLSKDDVAYLIDNRMKMPTKELFEELLTLPNKWTTINRVKGRVFAKTKEELNSKFNENTMLFIPAAGSKFQGLSNGIGSNCYLWSSSLNTDNPDYAWNFYFYSFKIYMYDSNRYCGYTIRPVVNIQNK